MEYYIGIDLGGTNVRVGKFDEEFNIIQEFIAPSYGLIGPKELIRDNIFSLLDKIENIDECKGIGIAVPGPVNIYDRTMTKSHNLIGFKGYPIAKMIEDKYQIPVIMENDANVAGLAEALKGAGENKDIVYYITHSTGIGGALIINGKIVSGKSGFAGEIGNIIVKENCQKYNELNAGAIEGEFSGSALDRKAKELYGEDANALTLFNKVKENDLNAQAIINEMADNMGKLLATISQIIDPQIIVFGGGVTKSKDAYWPMMIESYHKYFNGEGAEIKSAELKEPGMLGAALLVRKTK